ncbi:PHB depolymerase family esterase [Paenibacillus peoriae]|uniref:PHB depolymerase family esterase n=1 Tax=Paenibacillus peoriae TaxID=59893 RepID=UPI00026C66C4|nr:PHB depolymerase family esterase [Paenibacillus peoriae]MEC0184106.1 PHB depolymerase family esterase [Paenibacillus peoriae]
MKLLGVLLALFLFISFANEKATAQTISIPLREVNSSGSAPHYYKYDASQNGFESSRSDILSPSYYVYAGNLTLDEAKQLISNLGIVNNINEWGSTIRFINPLNQSGYDEKDAEAFIDLVSNGIVRNVKVIGIGEGATFVNNYLSDKGYCIAGIMLYGGSIDENKSLGVAIPAYLSNPSEKVLSYYVKGNSAIEKSSPNKTIKSYVNKENAYKQVIASTQNESLSEAFQNAWKQVFSKNYRMHNEVTEFYNSNPKDYTSEYTLTGIPVFEDLDLTYNQMIDQPVNGTGKYMWYEYVPSNIKTFPEKTVPLIVTLHGTGNDPRIQGDTSGWTELASKEKLIVVSPEWEDKSKNFNHNDGLGDAGVASLVKDLQKKYPQIDPSRTYVTGLSAGGSKTSLYGVKYSNIFAAAAAVSAPGVDKKEITEISKNYKGGAVPFMYMCGDHDYLQMIPVDGSSKYGKPGKFEEDPNVSMFEVIQAYQRINKLEVSKTYDMNANEYYGVLLDNQKWSKLGDKDMYSGTLSNDQGVVVMQLTAIKDLAHWNYKPEAELMWKFLEKYQRDIASGELIVSKH